MTRAPTSKALLADQRDNVNALERWLKFAVGDLNLSARDIGELHLTTLRRFVRRAPDASAIEELRRWLLGGFNKIIDAGEWVIPSRELGDFTIVIGRTGTAYEENSGKGRALVGLSLAKALHEEGWRLARCNWCGKQFIKHKRGEYCGRKCSQNMRTFKTRNSDRWAGVLKAAQKAKQPIAAYLLAQRKKPERYVTTCPVCKHEFEVREIPASVQCPSHKGYFVAGPLNSKTVEEK